MPSRRDFLRASLLAGGSIMLPRWARADRDAFAADAFPSPFLRPFASELPIPPVPRAVAPFSTARAVAAGTVFHELRGREGLHRYHPDLPPTRVWGYEDVHGDARAAITPGPTFVSRAGTPMLVRFRNELPADHRGFGVPNMVVHRHGGEQSSEDDGYPEDLFRPGESRDYLFPETAHPGDPRETQTTLWYHDHLVYFTAPNVYRGLAGFFIRHSDFDPGDESTPGSTGLRLPSGPYDIGLAIQDKRFAPDGALVYDSNQHDGYLGDTYVVNGAVQPFLRVKRRKYRFRFLCASNARFFELFLSTGQPFTQIATEGGLLERPLQRRSILMSPGERHEVILDFSAYPQGAEIVLENRLEQKSGRGPDGPAAFPTPILKFIVDGTASDPSEVPFRLREPFPADPFPPTVRRTFEFTRRNGAWAVNNELWDPERIVAQPRIEDVEVWTLRNSSGGWWHPIHIHLTLSQILSRNGRAPDPWDAGMRDMVVLGPNDECEVRVQFKQFRGRYVFHCHNVEHEDMAMMARFDTV